MLLYSSSAHGLSPCGRFAWLLLLLLRLRLLLLVAPLVTQTLMALMQFSQASVHDCKL